MGFGQKMKKTMLQISWKFNLRHVHLFSAYCMLLGTGE